MRKFICAAILFLCSLSLIAQDVDQYLGEAYKLIAKSEYSKALDQLNAAQSILDIRKVKQTDSQYLKLAKLKDRCQKCQSLYKSASKSLASLSEVNISERFSNVHNNDENDQVMNSLLNSLSSARTNLSEIVEIWAKLNMGVTDNNAKKLQASCPSLENSIKKYHADYESLNAWESACREDTKVAYESFYNRFPNTSYAKKAKTRLLEILDDDSWATAQRKGSVDALNGYLSKFPSGKHSREAKVKVADLTEASIWEVAKAEDSETSYENYLRRYPNGKYRKEASEAVNLISLKKGEQEIWDSVVKVGTVEAYTNYLKTSKVHAFDKEAKSAIAKIQYNAAVLEDGEIWRKIINSNDANDFRKYLNRESSASFHRLEAKSRLEQLEMKEDSDSWQSIISSTDPKVFKNYLDSDRTYKGHKKEAEFNYYLYSARSASNRYTKWENYKKAAAIRTLDTSDAAQYSKLSDQIDYETAINSKSESQLREFIRKHPYSSHLAEVKDALALLLLDKMNSNNYNSIANEASQLASSKSVKKQIEQKRSQFTPKTTTYSSFGSTSSSSPTNPYYNFSTSTSSSKNSYRSSSSSFRDRNKVDRETGKFWNWGLTAYCLGDLMNPSVFMAGSDLEISMGKPFKVFNFTLGASFAYFEEDFDFAINAMMKFNYLRFERSSLYLSAGAGYDIYMDGSVIGETGWHMHHFDLFMRYNYYYTYDCHYLGAGIRVSWPVGWVRDL